jgi:RNA polymerase sigma factor (sigma-70 family)
MTTVTAPTPPSSPSAIDVAQLYPLLNRKLARIVISEITAPDQLVEEACQIAWSRLLLHAHRIEPIAVLSWLANTAKHETVRLLVRRQRDLSLDELLDAGAELELPQTPSLEELFGQRERIRAAWHLNTRQRRALWLRAAGLSHDEIAAVTGDSRRTVERHLQRARHSVRRLAG